MAAQHYKLREALDEARQSAGELERERDEALRRAADQDAEVDRQREQAHKMARMLERTEADHRSLQIELRQMQEENRTLKAEYEQIQDEQHRERTELQHERSELQRLRREHRDALEQVAALKSEAHQSHMRSEELRGRLEVTISEQLQQINELEGTGQRTSQELDVQSSRAAGLGDALYTSLHERTALLHFLIDVLTTIRSLLEPPSAGSGSSRPSSPRTPRRGAVRRGATPRAGSRGVLARERSNSCERIHRHSGCYVCSGQGEREQRGEDWRASLRDSYGGARQAPNAGLVVSAEDVPAILEFIDSLERELGDASQEYGSLVQRLLAEAERTARVLRGELAPGHMPPSEQDVQRTCLDWIEQEQLRRERHQQPLEGPALCVDWSEERDRYQATTRSMEAKFAKLARLKRMMQVRQTPAPRKTRG